MPDFLALPSLPVADPVLIFAIAMVVFLVAPLLFEWGRMPGIVGLIVTGAAIGPNGLNVLARSSTIELLGTVGLLYLMFMIGLELDLYDFNKYRNRSIVFGLLTFLIPILAGTGLALAFGYSIASSLLLGSVFASHTVLAYPIASRLGIVKNLAVTMTLGGTILTEILALLVLAIVAGSVDGVIGPAFWLSLAISLSIYVAVIMVGVPLLARWFFRTVRSDATLEFVFVLAVLFTVSYLAHAAHVEPIIGALLAGLALNRLVPHHGTLMNRIQFMGDAFLIPFFLLSVGMLVDVRALSTVDAWAFSSAVALAVVAAKWLAAWGTRYAFDYTPEEGWLVFGLSVPHASGTLAIVLVGFEIGLFDQTEVNGIILTILVTSLIGPYVVERFGRKVAVQEEQKPYEPREAPQRILIPISNPATEQSLMELAMLMRGKESQEPLYPLMVVRDLEERSEEQVAEAEKMLSHAVIYAAGADVPVVPLTRVDPNIAAGIARGVAETRSTTVIVGWDGGRSRGTGVFGSVLDQLLELSKQMVIVARLGHPLNTTKRILLVLPSLVHRHPGFHEGTRGIKRIANQLGASILGLVVDGSPDRYERLFGDVKPAAAAEFEAVEGWGQVIPMLRRHVRADDTVVLFSARSGTLPWHPKLERLPRQLAGLLPETFLILYPPEIEPARRDSVAIAALPSELRPERIIHDLPSMPFDLALRRIVQEAGADLPNPHAVAHMLIAGEREVATEIRPGVIVPHARVAGLTEPMVILAICPDGIAFPSAREPAKLIFVLLSPADEPLQHLRALAEIARLVSRDEYVEELVSGERPPADGEEAPTSAS